MDDKELYDVLKQYAEDTKGEKEDAFKKLKKQSQEDVKHPKMRVKPRFVFAFAMCLIVVVLGITLPLTLKGDKQITNPHFASNFELINYDVESIFEFKDKYGMDAYYPTFEAEDPDCIGFDFTTLLNDSTVKMAGMTYIITDENYIEISAKITQNINEHVFLEYSDYLGLTNLEVWREFNIKHEQSFNERTMFYELKIYFTDGTYEYFFTVQSDVDLSPTAVLDMLYC